MAFFLIVPSVMIVSVLFVHALANRLGLRIYYPTLIAVIVVSIMVNLSAAIITPAISREYLLWLGLMILAASFLLTLANRFLLKRHQAEEKRFHEEVKAAYEAERSKDLPLDKSKWDEDILSDTPPAYNEKISELDEVQDVEKISEPDEVKDVEKISEPDEVQDVEKISEPDEVKDVEKSSEFDEVQDVEKISEPDKVKDVEKSSEPDKVKDVEKISEPDEVKDVEKISEPDEVKDVEKISELDEVQDVEKSSEFDEVKDVEKISEPDEVKDVEKISEFDEVQDFEKSLADLDEDLLDNPNLTEDFPLENVFKPLSEIKPEEADKPIKLEEKPPEEKFPLEEVFKPLSDVKPEEIKHFDTSAGKIFEHTEFFPLQEVFRPLSTLNLDKLEEITREEKKLPHEEEANPEEKIDTLDDLLDKAYNERDKGNIWQAIETYKKALERYRNDDYAPFVAIDLGNIYKDNALYSNAIKIYEEALTLPAVERNSETKKEFLNTLEYLRVVHAVLTRHRALSTPFNKLSKEILQDIDSEFKKAQY